MLTNLVEVQVSFVIIRVACHEYAFVPKIRAICLLDHVVEKVRFQSGLWHFSLMNAHIYDYRITTHQQSVFLQVGNCHH